MSFRSQDCFFPLFPPPCPGPIRPPAAFLIKLLLQTRDPPSFAFLLLFRANLFSFVCLPSLVPPLQSQIFCAFFLHPSHPRHFIPHTTHFSLDSRPCVRFRTPFPFPSFFRTPTIRFFPSSRSRRIVCTLFSPLISRLFFLWDAPKHYISQTFFPSRSGYSKRSALPLFPPPSFFFPKRSGHPKGSNFQPLSLLPPAHLASPPVFQHLFPPAAVAVFLLALFLEVFILSY